MKTFDELFIKVEELKNIKCDSCITEEKNNHRYFEFYIGDYGCKVIQENEYIFLQYIDFNDNYQNYIKPQTDFKSVYKSIKKIKLEIESVIKLAKDKIN